MGRRGFREKYEAACDDEENYERLMTLACQELPGYFEEVLEADEEELYSQARFDLEMSQLTLDNFPEENFDLLQGVLKDTRFLKSSNGWVLFSIFNDDWEKLSPAQKARLLEVLGEIYEQFDDWMPCFSISELVGETFPAASVFEFFHRFSNSQNETARTFVSHGYEHAIQTSEDEILTAKIWDALLQMKQDESEKVRGEAEESIQRLSIRGIKRP